MAIMIGLSLGLLISGLVIMLLSPSAHNPTLVTVIWWIGLVLVVFGVILLITPAMVWIYGQVRAIVEPGALR